MVKYSSREVCPVLNNTAVRRMLREHRRTRKPASIQWSASFASRLGVSHSQSVVGPAKPTDFELSLLRYFIVLVLYLRSVLGW